MSSRKCACLVRRSRTTLSHRQAAQCGPAVGSHVCTPRGCRQEMEQDCEGPPVIHRRAWSCIAQVVGLMRLPSEDQDDRLAKAALFSKYTELLPAALLVPHLPTPVTMQRTWHNRARVKETVAALGKMAVNL